MFLDLIGIEGARAVLAFVPEAELFGGFEGIAVDLASSENAPRADASGPHLGDEAIRGHDFAVEGAFSEATGGGDGFGVPVDGQGWRIPLIGGVEQVLHGERVEALPTPCLDVGAEVFFELLQSGGEAFFEDLRCSLGVASFELPTKQGQDRSGGWGDAVGLECGLLEMVEPCSEDRGGDLFEISAAIPTLKDADGFAGKGIGKVFTEREMKLPKHQVEKDLGVGDVGVVLDGLECFGRVFRAGL